MTNLKFRVAVMGGAGFAAGELIRLLLRHPRVQLVQVISSSAAGSPVGRIHPHLRGLTELVMEDQLQPEEVQLLFFCGRHGESMRQLPLLLAKHPSLKLIDLSGDFRLKDPTLYEKWYGSKHEAIELLPSFNYGLPEFNRLLLQDCSRVANPGCFATAITLALAPLTRAGLSVKASVTAVTGSSGAGASPSAATHHPTRAGTLRAYRPLRHQHHPEIVQTLEIFSPGVTPQIAFVPVSGPFVRGIYAICHVELPIGWSQRLEVLYQETYCQEPFVRVLPHPPDLQVVTGSNFCDIFATVEDGHAVIFSALDNLLKGAAGQALQNMNVMMGWDEGLGLDGAGAYP
jgi:N-acetyl-gamma-glutamyl-phosphate reductase